MTLGLGYRDHVEASCERRPFLFAASPRGQCLHFLQKLLEAGGMMDDENCRAVGARVVKAMDSLSRDEGERAGFSLVRLVADALTVPPVPDAPTAMNRPSPGPTTTALMTLPSSSSTPTHSE